MTYTPRDRERWVAEDPAHKRADRDDFARDRARLLHSASLRRLSAKTQVVQPGSDDFVRNRLTHSLEVAQIGREFGAALGCNADVVDTACLAHDLGHPALRSQRRVRARLGRQWHRRVRGQRADAARAHPTRSQASAPGRPASAGLNLTRATLDAATKYPWRRGHAPYPTVKFGAYDDDLDVFDWFRDAIPPGRRSIEAEVMDWSDDVAYSVHDVEDAIASGWLDPRRLRDAVDVEAVITVAGEVYEPGLTADELGAGLERVLATGAVPMVYDGSRRSLAALKDMTSHLIGRFVTSVEAASRAQHGAGPMTRHDATLVVPATSRAEWRGAQGGRGALRHVCRRAGRAPRASTRRGRGAGRRLRAASRPPRPRPATGLGVGPRRGARPCGCSSTRSPRSPTSGPCSCTAPGVDRQPGDRPRHLDSRQHAREAVVAGRIRAEDITTVKERTSIEDVVRDPRDAAAGGGGLAQGAVSLSTTRRRRASPCARRSAPTTASGAARAAMCSPSCRRWSTSLSPSPWSGWPASSDSSSATRTATGPGATGCPWVSGRACWRPTG